MLLLLMFFAMLSIVSPAEMMQELLGVPPASVGGSTNFSVQRTVRSIFPNALTDRLYHLGDDVSEMTKSEHEKALIFDIGGWEGVSYALRLPYYMDPSREEPEVHLDHPEYVDATKSFVKEPR